MTLTADWVRRGTQSARLGRNQLHDAGTTAEFIAEETSDQHGSLAAFTYFRPIVVMSGYATSNGNVGTAGGPVEKGSLGI